MFYYIDKNKELLYKSSLPLDSDKLIEITQAEYEELDKNAEEV